MKSDRDMISSIVPFALGKPMEKIKVMAVGTDLKIERAITLHSVHSV